jgi:sorting nexin-1/2
VTRRYSEFQWLHDALTEMCAGVLIPPLPKKEFFSRFEESFLQSRIRGLDAFLQRVTRHPLLYQQPFVKSFLETQDMKVSHAQLKSLQDSLRTPSRSMSSWFENKFGEMSVSKQEVGPSLPALSLSPSPPHR